MEGVSCEILCFGVFFQHCLFTIKVDRIDSLHEIDAEADDNVSILL